MIAINGVLRQLYPGKVLSRDILPEAKKYFYKPDSDATKFGLRIDVRSSNANQLHRFARRMERSEILLQIERAADVSDGDLVCYVFLLEDERFVEL